MNTTESRLSALLTAVHEAAVLCENGATTQEVWSRLMDAIAEAAPDEGETE